MMYVVVIGCGKTGSAIADLLSKNGEDVVVVDKLNSSFNLLSPEYTGFTVNGDATELEILLEAKIDKADLMIITTEIDSVNAMVSQIAKKLYDVPKVIVKINEPLKSVIYRNTGIITLSPTDLFIDKLRDKLSKEEGKALDEERTI